MNASTIVSMFAFVAENLNQIGVGVGIFAIMAIWIGGTFAAGMFADGTLR